MNPPEFSAGPTPSAQAISYASPPVGPPPTEPPPPYKLFDIPAITLATFLGSPLAGSVLLAVNYHRLGRTKPARLSVIYGILATAALIALGMLISDRISGYFTAIIPVIIMNALARSLQGPDLTAHQIRRGPLVSRWTAAGIGAGFLVLIIGVIFTAVVIQSSLSLGHKLQYSSTEEIYYRKQATQTDAQTLGDCLKQVGFFGANSTPKSVLLTKDNNGTIVTFIVTMSAWEDPAVGAAFQGVGTVLAAKLGKPLTVRLTDTDQKIKKDFKIE
jgi:hypothetical protein